MDFLLDGQKIHQGFMDNAVGIMTFGVQQAAEGVLHGPGGGGIDMGFDGREVNDIFPDKKFRVGESLWERFGPEPSCGPSAYRPPMRI